MPTQRRARRMAWGVAAAFVATAALHGSGYGAVAAMAAETQALADLVPMLWLSFAVDLAVVGLIVAAVAWRAGDAGWAILAVAGLAPFGAAALQIRFLGLIPPTVLLLVLALFTWVTAGVWFRSR